MPKHISDSKPVTHGELKQEFVKFEKKMEAMIDRKLEQKLEEKLEQKLEEKFEKYVSKLYDLIDTVLIETRDRRDEYDTNVGSIPAMKEEIIDIRERVERIEACLA